MHIGYRVSSQEYYKDLFSIVFHEYHHHSLKLIKKNIFCFSFNPRNLYIMFGSSGALNGTMLDLELLKNNFFSIYSLCVGGGGVENAVQS